MITVAINQVKIPYPDFKLHEIIDPEQFDLNNAELQNKINAVITVLNQITDSIADGSSGADNISLTAIQPFISTKLQSFLEEVISRLQSTQDGSSGADFIASTPIPGVTGATVQQQLESLKTILDLIQTQTNSNTTNISSLQSQINTHKSSADHDTRYYTKTQLDNGQLDGRYYTKVSVDAKDSSLQAQITNHKNSTILDHPDGSVTTAKLADNSVTTSKIANGSVTADKIHSSLLNTVSLNAHRNNSVLDHPDFSVTTKKLAPKSVTFDKLGLDVIGYIESRTTDAESKFTNINLNIIDMAVELETLKGATLNGVDANIFVETFTNLNDINLMRGGYDSVNKRLVV